MSHERELAGDGGAMVDVAAFLARIEDRSATVTVIGMGYVGLPLALTLAEQGFIVSGFDVDAEKVAALNAGQSYIGHISSESVTKCRDLGRFSATAELADVGRTDIMMICVPTPLSAHREPDMTYVDRTARDLAQVLRPGHLVILESTTYPGTTVELMAPLLEESGLRSGKDFFVAYSPEREDPGNAKYSTAMIPKVVGGDGADALSLAVRLYEQFTPGVVPVSSPDTAEAVKLTENIFRAVNIALVNELKIVYDAMGIDVWEVINAAKTKPFGFMPFYPGPGLGGHCIPIDPFYLTWKAREYEISTRFIELAGEVNATMPRYVVEKLAQGLDQRFGRGLKGARILVIGMAYKKNVDDIRESATLRVMGLLEKRGALVDYYDPYIPIVPRTRDHPEFGGRRSVDWTPAVLRGFDAAMILTDHDCVDYAALVESSKLVVDTRNATAGLAKGAENIIKA